MIGLLYDVVLVAVMVVYNPSGQSQVEYRPVDYYNSWSKCYQEEKRLSRTRDTRIGYVCLKVDRD